MLLGLLELLLVGEENVVRERAAASATAVVQAKHVDMVERLATKERFRVRISACGLIPAAFLRMMTAL